MEIAKRNRAYVLEIWSKPTALPGVEAAEVAALQEEDVEDDQGSEVLEVAEVCNHRQRKDVQFQRDEEQRVGFSSFRMSVRCIMHPTGITYRRSLNPSLWPSGGGCGCIYGR